jgi:hypothetical protein
MEDVTMRRQRRVVVAVAAWFLAIVPAQGQTPQDALKVVPEKAAGFVIVKNLGELNNKIETLAKRLGTPLPFSPMEKIKSELGVVNGLNTKGSLLFAFILDEGENFRPIPLLYVPVTDYAAFVKGLDARTDGDVSTVQLAKGAMPMIVGRQGSFAVFTEPTFKDALKEALRFPPGTGASIAALDSRLVRNDVTGVLTSRGIKMVAGKARTALQAMGNNAAQLPPESQFLMGWLEGADLFLKSIESDVTHFLVGTCLDKDGNLELDTAALFARGSGFAQAGAKTQSLQGEPMTGLPDVPFLFAFSGSMSGSFMEEIMKFSIKVITAAAKDVPAEKVKRLEQSAGKIFKDFRSMSMVVGTGKGKESLFQNSYAVMKVANAQTYLQTYEEYLDVYNSLMKEIKVPEGFPNQAMKATKTKVDGLPALEVTVDLGIDSNQLEPVKKLMEIYFGPGGKMVMTTVAVDKNTLLVRYTPATEVKEFIKTFKDRSSSLANNKDIAQTTKLLPDGSQWIFFISPHASIVWVNRIMEVMMPPPANAIHLPDFPRTAPVAIGVKFSATGLEKRLVIPAAVLDSVGIFIRQIDAAKGVPAAALSP